MTEQQGEYLTALDTHLRCFKPNEIILKARAEVAALRKVAEAAKDALWFVFTLAEDGTEEDIAFVNKYKSALEELDKVVGK